MKAALALALVLSTTASCEFAVKHPAITAGVVAGSLALGTCELAVTSHRTCFIASGAVGVGLALIAGGALWLGSEDAPAEDLKADPEQPPMVDPNAPPPAQQRPTLPTPKLPPPVDPPPPPPPQDPPNAP